MQIELLPYEQTRRCVYIFLSLFKDQPFIKRDMMLLSSYYVEWVQSLMLQARQNFANGDTMASAHA